MQQMAMLTRIASPTPSQDRGAALHGSGREHGKPTVSSWEKGSRIGVEANAPEQREAAVGGVLPGQRPLQVPACK